MSTFLVQRLVTAAAEQESITHAVSTGLATVPFDSCPHSCLTSDSRQSWRAMCDDEISELSMAKASREAAIGEEADDLVDVVVVFSLRLLRFSPSSRIVLTFV
jgi:hypothetical protein